MFQVPSTGMFSFIALYCAFVDTVFSSTSKQDPLPAKRLQLAEGSHDGQHFLAIKCYLIKASTLFFGHNAIAHLIGSIV